MKLEIGKRYITRNGQVTSPVEKNTGGIYNEVFPFTVKIRHERYSYRNDGRYFKPNYDHYMDLVEEYVDEVEQEGIRLLSEELEELSKSNHVPEIDEGEWESDFIKTARESKSELAKIEVKLGHYYKSEAGELIRINQVIHSEPCYKYLGSNGGSYSQNGNTSIDDPYPKLIEHIGESLGAKPPFYLEKDFDDEKEEKKSEYEEEEVYVRRFKSSAVRSDDRGRIRPDYISPYALEELAKHFTKAGGEFGTDDFGTNYFAGIEPKDVKGSISRHYIDLQKAFYPYNREAIREELRALAANCIMALHQMAIEDLGIYKEVYDKTEYIKKSELENGK